MTDADDADDAPDIPALGLDDFYDALESVGRPLLTATELARVLSCTQAEALAALEQLPDDQVAAVDTATDPRVWFPRDYKATADRERVVVFPGARRIVVDGASQFTRAQLSQFAHLEDANRDGGYVYEVREEDVWSAPYDDFAALERTMRQALDGRYEDLEGWVRDQWERARKFRLTTHEDGYTVLEAKSADLMGNVAERELEAGQIRALVSDTEAWIAEESVAAVKRTLYEAGYPVLDTRHLDTGEPLPVELRVDLREYQQEWVNRFVEKRSGILVGPPGSGKTVAAMGVMSAIEGETLVLVPGRELAAQWRETILEHTSLTPQQVGEYHGGTKQIRPVTVATYQTAGMDRHRHLFDDRKWGLIVYDEVHHIPSPVYRRSADLQAKHRLGLSATPVRETDDQHEIYTLIGPPIGTNWSALFDAGYVAEPEVEIRFVPWGDDEAARAYDAAVGHEKRQAAAENPAKVREIEAIRRAHPGAKTLVFVEYIDQGEAIAEALSVPFVSGEMPHARRRKLFDEFRNGPRDVLVVSRVGDEGIDLPGAEIAIAASGLGGSRRQGAQRAGRTMRPVGKARMYVLATRGTREEEFARSRTRHLQGKGIRVRERPAESVETSE
ncbi:DEAD/DEAH box helicase family protein [Halosegnis sp.]|uniref:DEAD/DEAH box helicase family protein n=1 Tax=Halosegnis sp. TaxID=2864959 RepID=UPI0035D4799B